jgi:hypothetical protein
MKRVYIAGPYSGANAWEVEQNVQRAEALIYPIAEFGFVPVCPHTMYRNLNGTLTYEKWCAITMDLLHGCHAVLMVSGWGMSRGAKAEHTEALRRGLPIYETFADLRVREDP